jgi:hypothetical protein
VSGQSILPRLYPDRSLQSCIDPAHDPRYAYIFNWGEDPPWYIGPAIFAEKQGRLPSHRIPKNLLEPIFSQFIDDCQNYRPTEEYNRFVQELSEKMCFLYPKYPGMDVCKEVLL